ncbi:MAG: hypothetical protein H6658_13495 [Ardenticatenaceae bacterium]|nr:hypothetical protein [Ardenticatenaceae bacterium]
METIEMKHNIPAWAKQKVTPKNHNYLEVQQLHEQGRTQIQLPDLPKLKDWAKSQSWPTPWFGFQKAFIAKLFESDETFTLALNKSGINIHVPIKEHTLTLEMVKELDALYEEREDVGGRPTQWGSLVSELREIRRLVEAGIKVNVEGTETVLTTWQGFYNWAHGRYHMLEDGYDSWIGDDDS